MSMGHGPGVKRSEEQPNRSVRKGWPFLTVLPRPADFNFASRLIPVGRVAARAVLWFIVRTLDPFVAAAQTAADHGLGDSHYRVLVLAVIAWTCQQRLQWRGYASSGFVLFGGGGVSVVGAALQCSGGPGRWL